MRTKPRRLEGRNELLDRIVDLTIITLAALGVGWEDIRKALAVDGNRVAKFTKAIKKAREKSSGEK